MGAGILPLSYHNNELYLLFSKEYRNYKGKPDWRDFGGTPEKNETILQTAIREGWEESSGFLGSKSNIEKLIRKNLVTKVNNNKYTVYVVLIEYDEKLPVKFKKHFTDMYKKDKSKICKNGFYEKSELRWIKVKNIYKHMDMFTSWYKPIVKKIYQKLNNKN